MNVDSLLARRTSVEVGEGLKEILQFANAKDVISFAGGFPDAVTFPGTQLVEVLDDLVKTGDTTAMQYSPTPGVESVRDYLQQRIGQLQGLRPGADELIVTSGAVEAVELLCKRFLDPSDVVLVEAPTYLGAIMAFRGHEANVVCVETDDDGLQIEHLEELLRSGLRPKLMYSIPDYQNPRGISLAAERRRSLVELAARYGFLVIEDVAYRELYFDEEPPASLWSLDPSVVVQVGTFSKLFFPGVRLGWGIGPSVAVQQMVIAKQNTDQCAGALGQRLLEEYGRRGFLDEGLVASRELYARRRDRLAAALDQYVPDTLRWNVPRGGFFVWLEGPKSMDSVTMAREAREQGITFVPGLPFFPDGRGRANIRLAFSRVEGADLDEGCSRLGELLARSA